MTTKLIDHSPALVQAIKDIFHRAKACHCQGDGKLSENEVLEQLVLHHYVTYAAANQPKFLPIDEALSDVRDWPGYQMRTTYHVNYLPELEAWTYADLLRLRGIGPVSATAIEAEMAKYGLALKDGDPNRYAHLLVPQSDTAAVPEMKGTPDEIRRKCAKELIQIGKRLLTHGGTLIGYSIRIGTRERIGGHVTKHAETCLRAHGETVSVGNVLQALEAREATSKPVAKRGRRARRVGGEIVQQGTVVTGAFPQAAVGD